MQNSSGEWGKVVWGNEVNSFVQVDEAFHPGIDKEKKRASNIGKYKSL